MSSSDDGSSTEKSTSTMDPSTEKSPSMEGPTMSPSQRTMAVVALTGISFLNTMGSGMLTVALPQIAKDIGLADNILLWPASVYALAAGCTLLIFGSVADVAGDKPVWITGSILYTFFTLGCGLSKSAAQLIAFRTLLGISIAMCLPSAVSLMTRTFGPGKMRNIGFASMGMGQPLGYSVGLILGGVFADSIGWRYGFYISAILNAILSVLAFWCLPPLELESPKSILKGCLEIDWVGAIMISASLGLISFVLAQLTNNYNSIGDAYIIVLLVVSIVLLPAFGVWAGWRERKNRPALIPNSLWKNSTFTSTCIIVFFTWAVFNAFQYFSSLYFQNVQHHSALASSIRFIPMVVVGAATNIFTGFVVDKIQVRTLVFVSAIICLVPPLLMALVKPEWGYWQGPFVAMLLSPLHPDVLFTVSNLIISQAYPGKNQSLAGAVFNSVSQVGNSVGLAVSAVVAASVTDHAASHDLEKGYQAAFWMMFAAMIVVCIVSFFGLRSGGKVGKKSE